MNERLDGMVRRVRAREHKRYRQMGPPEVVSECQAEQLSWMKRVARMTRRQCEAERVIIQPDERIVYTRTIPGTPAVHSAEEWARLIEGRSAHELWVINNICPDWEMVLSQGLLGRKLIARTTKSRFAGDPEALEFLDGAIECIDAVLGLASRYAGAARMAGRSELAEVLRQVPANRPRGFYEALQFLRLCHGTLWLGGHYHIGLGRFDQYMWPYLKADLDTGRLDIEQAEELLAEFFISLNKDTDLYPGVQRGDNGQSLTIGGVKADGSDGVNELTRMVLRVSGEVGMIDPKINFRISPNTDLELLALAAELTRKGLGFPQYSNEDVVIPALTAHGYALEDARNYTVAACWEFIIPGKGMEIVNVGAVSMPGAADRAIREGLMAGEPFEVILARAAVDISQQLEKIIGVSAISLPPAPYFSVVMSDCLERGRDLSCGAKYNNYGVHGACSASAADALAAVKKLVYDEKSIAPDELLRALNADFRGYEPIREKLAEEGPKVGNNDETADGMLVRLFDFFAEACEEYTDNGRGGIVRPGTGSAMFYLSLAKDLGATAEGRRKGEPFSANLSPSHGARVRGPISILQSYAKIDYQRIYNGGPITMELSDSVFRDADGVRKVAMLVRTFAQLGCQQLQLNALNHAALVDAKEHPENHKNLIVRVWGWSGYFCELAPEYQDHIIARALHGMD